MTKIVLIALNLALIATCLAAEDTAKVPPTKPAKPGKKPAAAKAGDSNAPDKLKGFDMSTGTTGPITTEIFADEAFFDSNKSVGIFRGKVKVNDPRFNLQSDKLTVFISKGENQGLEKAVAEGNVAVVRDRPDPNGGPPSHAVGRSESAVYVAATGDVELKGMPRVQQGLNTHIGTSPDTVMIINQSGQLTTRGPSRTDIRQEPKDDKAEGEKGDKKPAEKEEKKAAAKEESKSSQPSPKP